jgi:protein SCO1/2
MKANTNFVSFVGILGIVCLAAFSGCQREREGDYPAANKADCLPDITLLDQNGRAVSLASLKGRPILIDFVYTSCKGPCPMLTAKLASVAKLLGPKLGSKVELVSITLDPEHDHPAELSEYAKAQGANQSGWLFLTGTPAQIEQVLGIFELRRDREADGSLTHNVASFLLGPDGRQVRQYNGLTVKPESVVADIDDTLDRG